MKDKKVKRKIDELWKNMEKNEVGCMTKTSNHIGSTV